MSCSQNTDVEQVTEGETVAEEKGETKKEKKENDPNNGSSTRHCAIRRPSYVAWGDCRFVENPVPPNIINSSITNLFQLNPAFLSIELFQSLVQ